MTIFITKEDFTRDTLRKKGTLIRFQCKDKLSLRG
jgi:hypothetical protein